MRKIALFEPSDMGVELNLPEIYCLSIHNPGDKVDKSLVDDVFYKLCDVNHQINLVRESNYWKILDDNEVFLGTIKIYWLVPSNSVMPKIFNL